MVTLSDQLSEKFERDLINVLRNTHISDEELDLYADGKGSDFLRARVKAHIKSCVFCRVEVETMEEYRYGIFGEELEIARANSKLQTKEDVRKRSDKKPLWFEIMPRGHFAVPVFAATLEPGGWSEEKEFFDGKAGYIERELGDGQLEQRFILRTEEHHNIQWKGDDYCKDVELEKGAFGWTGTLILTIKDRKKFNESEVGLCVD